MWFFFVFCLALLVGFRAMGILDTSIGTFMSVLPMLMPVMYLMEAYCIDRWGATPGKALVGIQIRDADGNSLGFASAFRRSLGVFVLGMGCYVDLLSPIAMMFGYYLLMKNRRSFWDISTGSYVHHAPFQAKHVLLPLAIMSYLFTRRNAGSLPMPLSALLLLTVVATHGTVVPEYR